MAASHTADGDAAAPPDKTIAQLIPTLSVDGLIGVCIQIDAFLDARVCQPYKQLFCFANYSSLREKQRHEGVLPKISQVNGLRSYRSETLLIWWDSLAQACLWQHRQEEEEEVRGLQ